MILSASRRTDIPAFYSDWFFNRIKEGYVLVKNPMNPKQISRVSLDRAVVDCIVFWTKNPAAMIPKLDWIAGYNYYFQYTLNPYGPRLEPNVPPRRELIDTFIALSEKAGKNRVVWRYDPIILSEEYTVTFHSDALSELAKSLSPFTNRVVISFVDLYRKSKRNLMGLKINEQRLEQMQKTAASFAAIAHLHNLEIVSCAEESWLQQYGILPGKCIDDTIIAAIAGYSIDAKKDKKQRPACGCVESVDIGSYDTCPHGCRYCYANADAETARHNVAAHDPLSPLLYGKPEKDDHITVRKTASWKVIQESIFT